MLRAAIDPPGRSLAPGADTDGGGGTTFVASAAPVPFGALRALAEVLPPLTLGGGGTTSVVPKILPTRLLIKPPLPDGVGGGGTTDLDGSATLPEASRCKSLDMSVDGGGAIMEGAGIVSFAVRALSRSGEETGGGTTATFVICTGDREICGLATVGAGGITVPANAGVLRARSEVTLGAGAMTLESNFGATRVCSRETFGAGAMTSALSEGAVRTLSRVTLGAGGMTEGADRPPRV